MRIIHTEEVHLFHKVTRIKQALLQHILSTVGESYLSDIRNFTINSINETVVIVLTHLQENYRHIMPHKPLEHKGIIKKTSYHPHKPIPVVFSKVKELLGFSNITRTLYTHHQAVNISYVIIHTTGKFALAICKWNPMPTVQKTWVRFENVFGMANRKLR